MTNQSKYYKVEGDKLVRANRTCQKCGPGYFLANHYDRWACGNCGYTIFKRKTQKGATTQRPRRRAARTRTKSQ